MNQSYNGDDDKQLEEESQGQQQQSFGEMEQREDAVADREEEEEEEIIFSSSQEFDEEVEIATSISSSSSSNNNNNNNCNETKDENDKEERPLTAMSGTTTSAASAAAPPPPRPTRNPSQRRQRESSGLKSRPSVSPTRNSDSTSGSCSSSSRSIGTDTNTTTTTTEPCASTTIPTTPSNTQENDNNNNNNNGSSRTTRRSRRTRNREDQQQQQQRDQGRAEKLRSIQEAMSPPGTTTTSSEEGTKTDMDDSTTKTTTATTTTQSTTRRAQRTSPNRGNRRQGRAEKLRSIEEAMSPRPTTTATTCATATNTSSSSSSSNSNNNGETSSLTEQQQQQPQTSNAHDTPEGQNNYNNNIDINDNAASRQEEDDFAARMISQQQQQAQEQATNDQNTRRHRRRQKELEATRSSRPSSQQNNNDNNDNNTLDKTNKSTTDHSFQIDIQANKDKPLSRVDITLSVLRGPEMEGLLAVILMALTVDGFGIYQFSKIMKREVDGGEDEEIETSSSQEEDDEKRQLLGSSSSSSNGNGNHGEYQIVVDVPDGVDIVMTMNSHSDGDGKDNDKDDDNDDDDNSKHNNNNNDNDNNSQFHVLRLLILSACEDFVSPQGSLRPLMDTFETTVVEQNSSSCSSSSRSNQINCSNIMGGIQEEEQDEDENEDLLQATSSSSISNDDSDDDNNNNNQLRHRDTIRSIPSTSIFRYCGTDTTSGTSSSTTPRVGAVPTMGRAFGAPVRRPRGSVSLGRGGGGRRASTSLWQNTRQWISSRIMSVGAISVRSNLRDSQETTTTTAIVPIAAEVVDETEDIEANIRERLMMEAATASIVTTKESDAILEEAKKEKRRLSTTIFVLTLLLVGTVVGVSVGFSKRDDDRSDTDTTTIMRTQSPTATPIPTLWTIAERGTVRCSVTKGFGIGLLETELCKGLAAAVLGDASKIELIDSPTEQDGWNQLSRREIDVHIQSPVRTTLASLREKFPAESFIFSSPYFYDGFVFAGPENFVECADRLDTFFGVCRRMVVCLRDDFGHQQFVSRRIPLQNLRVVSNFTNVLTDELCTVIGTDASIAVESLEAATSGASLSSSTNFTVGSTSFTHQPLAMATRTGDYEWTLFVETFLQGLLEAEAREIYQDNASDFPDVLYAGNGYERMVANAVVAIGNFGEIYNQTIGSQLYRKGLNKLRTDNCTSEKGGLIYGFPFGERSTRGPMNGPGPPGSAIKLLLDRSKLSCGVPASEDPFHKFNMDLCRAIAVALFGPDGQFEIVEFATGSIEAFTLLQEDKVDVILGVSSRVLPQVGFLLSSYQFSRPYLYRSMENGTMEGFLFATKSDNHKLSMSVEWVVNLLIMAAEMLISKGQADFLPEIKLFGPSYDQVFLNIILAVGNYEELYKGAFDTNELLGCNQLNAAPHGPEHFPFLFHGL